MIRSDFERRTYAVVERARLLGEQLDWIVHFVSDMREDADSLVSETMELAATVPFDDKLDVARLQAFFAEAGQKTDAVRAYLGAIWEILDQPPPNSERSYIP